MPVGGMHEWEYPHGIRLERKPAPDHRDFTFRSGKRRMRDAPAGSGALPGTGYHWFIPAHQRVKKPDCNTYATVMEGIRFKVAHKRPPGTGVRSTRTRCRNGKS